MALLPAISLRNDPIQLTLFVDEIRRAALRSLEEAQRLLAEALHFEDVARAESQAARARADILCARVRAEIAAYKRTA